MRTVRLFNNDWFFSGDKMDFEASEELFEAVTLPHTNKLFPHHNFDCQEYQFISTYRKEFAWNRQTEGQQVSLDFDGAMIASTVYLNGQFVGEHRGGYAPFSIDITEALWPGDNTLTVYVDSRERTDIPPYGHLVGFLPYGGIYRDVYLRIVNACHIDNVFVSTENVLVEPQLAARVRLHDWAEGLLLSAALKDQHGEVIAVTQTPVTGPTTHLPVRDLPAVDLWSIDQPILYTLEISLETGGRCLDRTSTRFGFRQAEFRDDGGFYLNGERLKLIGLSRHQTYPYIGAAAPARLQRQDADILKYELACNVVRTSHYPQSPHFLDRCDEIGLLVFEEMTGWQHIGDEGWQALYMDELRRVIERDRNHPSIILWGVRVNESLDNDNFYTQTNALAHKLDPRRQTGGVRDIRGQSSSFLEDVYTYNDFSNSVVEPVKLPYLITEFGGHMFPTKIWDHEERLVDHALLHVKVQNLQLGDDRIAGAIGWLLSDHAAPLEFGSGDRICYHGVMDIFRLPKWAAHFYKSQQSPTQQIVLQAATHWTMGDSAGGGTNPLFVFSNCDEIEVIVGHSLGRFKPDWQNYPHLPHPPFVISGLDEVNAWGQKKFYDLQVIGYLDGRQVAEQKIASNRLPHHLELRPDANQIFADGADMTRLVFRITDEFGNPLPYATQIVTFEIKGDADLIGENPFPLVGGQAALYVKARHQLGTAIIKAYTPGLSAVSVKIDLIPPSK